MKQYFIYSTLQFYQTKMKFKFLMLLSISSLMIACSQEEEFSLNQEHRENLTRSIESYSYKSSLEQRRQIAEWFARNYSLADAQRVHHAVTKAISHGLDEVLFFKEYSAPSISSNKISTESPSETSTKFSKFCEDQELYDNNRPKSSNHLTQPGKNPLLINDNLQIYWPYSENWDGKTAPAIVYAPENINDLSATGYIPTGNGDELKTVTVTESFCETYPVWIINESETPLSKLPNFNKGENISSDGICYPQSITTSDSPASYSSGQNTVNTWQVVSMQVKRQYDTWIAGGSEIVIQVAYPIMPGYAAGTSRYTIRFKRKDIKKKRWKTFSDVYLNTNWRPEQISNFLLITESDPDGRNIDIPVSLQYNNKETGISGSVSTTLRIRGNDEEIAHLPIDRDFMLLRNTLSFDEENVYISMPITTEK